MMKYNQHIHHQPTAEGRPQQQYQAPMQRPPQYGVPTVAIPTPPSGSWPSNHYQRMDCRPVPYQQSLARQHMPPTSGLSTPGPSVKEAATSKLFISPDLPVDYRILLLSLSDHYINEARAQSVFVAHNQPGGDIALYFKLMATGMACLEAVLKQYSRAMPPRQIAILQLRYAALLYEDTENIMEAEELLGNAVTFCERNRLLDLKYAMQHLLAKVLFKSNVNASFKYLGKVIDDASTCQHMAWIYALRFLRVDLLVQIGDSHELLLALQDLRIIAEFAKRRGDSAIITASAILEAIIHVRSQDVESMDEAQRAVASARAYQLNDATNAVPQLTALVHFVDMAGSLAPYNYHQAITKMSAMHIFLDDTVNMNNWSRDGTFAVPITRMTSQALVGDTGGIFTKNSANEDCLTFSWLGRSDVYLIGFVLSGAASYFKTEGKGEKFIREGLRMAEDSYQVKEASPTNSLSQGYARTHFRKILKCYLLLHKTFGKCAASNWIATQQTLDAFDKTLATPGLSPPADLLRFAIYLKGVVNQAIGKFAEALAFYQCPELALPINSNKSKSFDSPTHEVLAILAALNTLLIIRPSDHPLHEQIEEILGRFSSFFPSDSPCPPANRPHTTTAQSNPHLRAAYNLLLPLLTSTTTTFDPSLAHPRRLTNITLTKKYLRHSLDLATACSNKHLRTLVLNFLASAFFSGQTGHDALEHAQGALYSAREAGSGLWACVADGALAEIYERDGMGGDAKQAREEAETLIKGGALPEGLMRGG